MASNVKTFDSEQAAAQYLAEHPGEDRAVVLRADGSRVILNNGRRTEIAPLVVLKAPKV